MTSDTRPAQPVTPVTADPSRRHTHCDGHRWAATCANGSRDGCDGFRPTPSHPAQTVPVKRCESPVAQPVTPGPRSSGSLVERVVSGLSSGQAPARSAGVGLPLAPLSVATSTPSLYYIVTPVDARGRLADRSPIRALGWRPGQPITITVIRQAMVVTSQDGGAESITRQGHLRLPARIRHTCRLNTGDRLLVAAAPTPGVLVVYTVALLESILLKHHATASSSEAPR
jgi:hypothetical protein